MKFPITAFHRNIWFAADNKIYGAYRFKAVPYRFLSLNHKETAVGILEGILIGFTEGRGQILLLNEEISMDEDSYLQGCNVSQDKVLQDEAMRHARAVRKRLSRGARNRRRYIIFELNIKQDIFTDINGFLHAARDITLNNFLGVKSDIPKRIKALAEAEEEKLFLRLKNSGFHRADFQDLDFISRRTANRTGVIPVQLPERPAGIMNEGLVTSFTDGAIVEEKFNYLRVQNSSGEIEYQSYIFATNFPNNIPPSGYDILSSDNLEFPFDVCIHFELIKPHIAKQKVNTKKGFLKAQIQEALSAGQSPEILEEEGVDDSDTLQVKTQSGKPLARMSLCFGIASKNSKELHSRSTTLCQKLISDGFYAVRPLSIQDKAMRSFIPGAQPAAPMIECDPGYISAIGSGFASELGDPIGRGFFVGWSGDAPVFWSPDRPAKELNKTNAILISGNLGGGKSNLAKLLAYFVMLSGGYVFAIDPKNEYFPFEELFPGYVRKIDLSPRSDTCFNPFMLSRDQKRANTIAQNYLTRALNAVGNESRQLAIKNAVSKVMALKKEDRHMDTAILMFDEVAKENHDDIEVQEQAKKSATILRHLKQSDIGSLIFGEKTVSLYEGTERMIVANIMELPRPDETRVKPEEWSDSERQGVAIIYLIAAIAGETAFGLPRHLIKMNIFDEAWVLKAISEGKIILHNNILIGRTYNLIPTLIAQNMSVISWSDIENNISHVFCFRASASDEVKTNLRVLGGDTQAVSTKDFAELKSGSGLYRDAESRIDWLNVDPQPPYLLDVFDTKPTEKE